MSWTKDDVKGQVGMQGVDKGEGGDGDVCRKMRAHMGICEW